MKDPTVILPDIPCTEEELNIFLSKFEIIHSLKALCNYQFQSTKSEYSSYIIDISLKLINFGKQDSRCIVMIDKDITRALKMFFYLENEKLKGVLGEKMFQLKYSQNDNHENFTENLSRTLHLFKNLPDKYREKIKEIRGFSLNELLLFSYSFLLVLKLKCSSMGIQTN